MIAAGKYRAVAVEGDWGYTNNGTVSAQRNLALSAASLDNNAGGTANGKDIGRPAAGKTGTTDGAAATWMSGASTKVATVVGVRSSQVQTARPIARPPRRPRRAGWAGPLPRVAS